MVGSTKLLKAIEEAAKRDSKNESESLYAVEHWLFSEQTDTR